MIQLVLFHLLPQPPEFVVGNLPASSVSNPDAEHCIQQRGI
ncbi:hypothetical protein [Synechococcus sp. M16CYN]